jgi:serine/threonine protein kinase
MKPGDSLDGRYTIIERLGAGGMGEVYKATHTILGAPRVIKVVHPHISSNEDARERFLREARASTKVQHQNVATMHDFASTPDGAHYMVWEFIDGENLAQRLRTHRTLPPRQAVKIAIQALHGLEAIHRAGIIHRDISPENLMITADDVVKIIDLGVAKVEGTEAVSQTRTGIFVGKLRYAAPEQLGFLPEGEKIDARADLYSLAMVLVELLTGRPPYEAKSPHEYFILHAREPQQRTVALPADLPGSAALEAILEKALARDRARRFASAREFAAALEEVEKTLPLTNDLPTMALALDGEATMRQATSRDTLHRTTVQTDAPAEPTLRTPLPAPTVRTPFPSGEAQPKLRKGLNPAYAVAFIAIVALAIGAALFWPRNRDRDPIVTLPATDSAPAQQAAATPPPVVSQTSVTVTSLQEEPATETVASPAVTTTVPATSAPPAPKQTAPPVAASPIPSKKQRETPPATQPTATAEVDPEPRATGPVPTYVDGGGDDDTNERALEVLRQELQGTKKVALRAGAMQVEVARALRDRFPELEFVAYAPVVLRFDGTMERMGRGRKRRAATATVTKDGRVVFRYELPDEVYRVGDDPPEAFARVVADAMQQ